MAKSKDEEQSLYVEVCEVVDMVREAVDQNPELSKTDTFLQYATVFSRVVKRILYKVLAEEDVVALKNSASKVLPTQLPN